ncbi:hypothetical protein EG856_01715 [Mycoplasmopsis phocirhinis]|uniref:Uncharacterized protein n=1 Tax=Mycoplasmopsis phocirhinis TaxID=142650 RepID=A0A4P6MSH7_9BACT|nr:hypothetical protein [Mycoplasmopsis phocirhinis]QBF34634.1 hypothetical protein EG856_01715 [Mycoplasmopsis phocirhinis]
MNKKRKILPYIILGASITTTAIVVGIVAARCSRDDSFDNLIQLHNKLKSAKTLAEFEKYKAMFDKEYQLYLNKRGNSKKLSELKQKNDNLKFKSNTPSQDKDKNKNEINVSIAKLKYGNEIENISTPEQNTSLSSQDKYKVVENVFTTLFDKAQNFAQLVQKNNTQNEVLNSYKNYHLNIETLEIKKEVSEILNAHEKEKKSQNKTDIQYYLNPLLESIFSNSDDATKNLVQQYNQNFSNSLFNFNDYTRTLLIQLADAKDMLKDINVLKLVLSLINLFGNNFIDNTSNFDNVQTLNLIQSTNSEIYTETDIFKRNLALYIYFRDNVWNKNKEVFAVEKASQNDPNWFINDEQPQQLNSNDLYNYPFLDDIRQRIAAASIQKFDNNNEIYKDASLLTSEQKNKLYKVAYLNPIFPNYPVGYLSDSKFVNFDKVSKENKDKAPGNAKIIYLNDLAREFINNALSQYIEVVPIEEDFDSYRDFTSDKFANLRKALATFEFKFSNKEYTFEEIFGNNTDKSGVFEDIFRTHLGVVNTNGRKNGEAIQTYIVPQSIEYELQRTGDVLDYELNEYEQKIIDDFEAQAKQEFMNIKNLDPNSSDEQLAKDEEFSKYLYLKYTKPFLSNKIIGYRELTPAGVNYYVNKVKPEGKNFADLNLTDYSSLKFKELLNSSEFKNTTNHEYNFDKWLKLQLINLFSIDRNLIKSQIYAQLRTDDPLDFSGNVLSKLLKLSQDKQKQYWLNNTYVLPNVIEYELKEEMDKDGQKFLDYQLSSEDQKIIDDFENGNKDDAKRLYLSYISPQVSDEMIGYRFINISTRESSFFINEVPENKTFFHRPINVNRYITSKLSLLLDSNDFKTQTGSDYSFDRWTKLQLIKLYSKDKNQILSAIKAQKNDAEFSNNIIYKIIEKSQNAQKEFYKKQKSQTS